MIDLDDNRLEVARSFGASKIVKSSDGKVVERVMALTQGDGINVAIESGRCITNVGVSAKSVVFHLDVLCSSTITLATCPTDAGSAPMLLMMIQSVRFNAKKLVSYRFNLSKIMRAYDIFANSAKHLAEKVALKDAIASGEVLKESP